MTEVLKENETAKKFFLKNGFKIIKFDRKENQYLLEKN
jgi:nitrous oxide reductase accessory protein NosL